MSSNGPNPLSGGRVGRPRSISAQMFHIQVVVPVEVEYAMNFRDELDQYLKLFPKTTDQAVITHFTSSAKPMGLNDGVIDEMLRKSLAKRAAAKGTPQEERDGEGSKYFLLGITDAGTDTFVGFYTDKMMQRLTEINREISNLKLELEQEDVGDEYGELGVSAEDLGPIRDRISKLEAERQSIYSKSNKLGRELALQDHKKFADFIKDVVKPKLAGLTSQTGVLFSQVHQRSTGKQAPVIWNDESLKPSSRPSAKL